MLTSDKALERGSTKYDMYTICRISSGSVLRNREPLSFCTVIGFLCRTECSELYRGLPKYFQSLDFRREVEIVLQNFQSGKRLNLVMTLRLLCSQSFTIKAISLLEL